MRILTSPRNQVIVEPYEGDYSPSDNRCDGTFYSHFKTDIEKIPFENLKLKQYEMQKIALLGTAHIVRFFCLKICDS